MRTRADEIKFFAGQPSDLRPDKGSERSMGTVFKLFHFDIATENNFGDTLLFPAVKHMFEAYGAGEAFDIYDSRPLRENVGPALVKYINRTADAVVVGGGGLFLSDTNPNRESGWQWRISLDMLEQLEVPLIVFAVGYNRFYGQPDFEPPFSEHVARTIEKSVFFGLRNHGSIEKVAEYVPDELKSRITYQPCPTTLSKSVLPIDVEQPDAKRIGLQLSTSRRYAGHGVGPDMVIERAGQLLPRLEEAGWDVVFTPFTNPDQRLSARLGEQSKSREMVQVYGDDVLTRGLRDLADVPFLLGCRGHAQMIPFGLGALPFSFDVHPKLGYFLSDIGRPEWRHDPKDPAFAESILATIEDGWENREANRTHIADKQADFLDITLDNLDVIYSELGGDPSTLESRFAPYDAQAWNMARSRFLLEVQRENSIHRQQTSAENARKTEAELKTALRNCRTAADDRQILEATVLREQVSAGTMQREKTRIEEKTKQLEQENRALREQLQQQGSSTASTRLRRVRRNVGRTVDNVMKRGQSDS